MDDIEECVDAAGQKYYHNKTTGKTGWSREELCTVSAATGVQNIQTHTDDNGGMPYSSESAWRPIVDALVKSGVRSLADVAQLTTTDVPSVHKDDLKALQNDPRVLRHTQKQEL